jgi:hypothetical protein
MTNQATSPARHDEVSRQTAAEHDALQVAMGRVERALRSPSPGRERDWAQAVADALRTLVAALTEHKQSTEATDGLLAELLHAMPQAQYQIGRIRADHALQLQQAVGLREEVERMSSVGVIAVDAIRYRAGLLLGAIRIHIARQVDLIYEAFNSDIGTCD